MERLKLQSLLVFFGMVLAFWPLAAWSKPISKAEVEAAQKAWSDGVVEIAKAHRSDRDYRSLAAAHVDKMYAYQHGPVLFKPTLAADSQFRLTREGALSYFVGGNSKYSEDKGFAIKPWTSVRWDNADIITDSDSAMAMGNYFFTDTSGKVTKVEYTFGYKRDEDGDLRIVLHHSSLPFNPK